MTQRPFPAAIASDHAGIGLKERIRAELVAAGHPVLDLGPATAEPVDYPDFAEAVARRVASGEVRLGILVCGTGLGMSISANKFPGVRAALLYDDVSARYARLHNDANVVVFGARTMEPEAALSRLRIFLSASFEDGRHSARLEKIRGIEKRLGLSA